MLRLITAKLAFNVPGLLAIQCLQILQCPQCNLYGFEMTDCSSNDDILILLTSTRTRLMPSFGVQFRTLLT